MPVPISRRHRSEERRCHSEVNRVDDGLAIDCTGDRLPELLACQPGRAPGRLRVGAQVEREEVGIEADADINHSQPILIRKALERCVVLRANVAIAHQVDFSAFETERLGVLVGHDGQREAIEIRQLHAGLVMAEVVWIAGKDQALSGHVLDELKRAEPGDIGERLRRQPRVLELLAVQCRFQLVPRDDRQAIEQAQAGHEGLWKTNHDRPRIGRCYVELLAVDREVRAYRALEVGIVGGAKREQHVGRRERARRRRTGYPA